MKTWRQTIDIVSVLASCSVVCFAQATAQTAWRPQHVVDLSYALDEDFPWIEAPGTFGFSKSPIATIETVGVAANAWTIHEHLGTQIDAPSHFAAGGRSLDQLRPDELFAPIAVIDFREAAEENIDAEITVETLEGWEAEHGRIPEGAIVVMNSGWGERVTDAERFINLDEDGVKRFPGFGREAVAWLMDERAAWGVGVDTISFDPGRDEAYRSHKVLEERGGWAIEALANLDALPPVGATLIVGAVNVEGATGGPVRPIAVWNDETLRSARAPVIEGEWTSLSPEPIPNGAGGRRYLTRDFAFAGGGWRIDFTMHADADRTELLYGGTNTGRYAVGAERIAPGTYPARFGFETRTLTPGTPEIASALTEAGCGGEPWRVGKAQEVLSEGCDAFRVFSQEECEAEFDVVKLDAGRLYLGQRPADGFMCSAETRPARAGTAALIRDDS